MKRWRIRLLRYCAALVLAGGLVPALAGEEQIQLKPGAGHDVVMANCILCHSLDMIQINSPFIKKEKWAAIVNKMRKVMGAPIQDEDVPAIVNYLSQHYGVD